MAQLNQLYLKQVNFQPIKCTRFVRWSNQKVPFDNLVWFNLVLLASVNGAIIDLLAILKRIRIERYFVTFCRIFECAQL